MLIDIKNIDSDTSSSMTMYEIPSREEVYSAPCGRWSRARKWCKRLARSCSRGDKHRTTAFFNSPRMTSSHEKKTSNSTQSKPHWTQRFASGVMSARLAKIRSWLHHASSSTDWELESAGLMKAGELELEYDILTASSECGSPITPMPLLMTRWEMDAVIEAVEADGACDTPRKAVARPPALITVTETDEGEDEQEDFSYPVVDFKKRDRLLSVVYEDDECAEYDGDVSGPAEPWELDDTFSSFGFDSPGDLSDDEIPPALMALTQDFSPSKRPWIRARCKSAPAALPSQTPASPPPTPPKRAHHSTPAAPVTAGASTPGLLVLDTSADSSFEALRRFWAERCEADSSFGSSSSASFRAFAL